MEAGGGAKLCKYSRQWLCKHNVQRLLARAMLSDARIADVAPLVRNDPHLEAGAGAHAARITSANSRAGAALQPTSLSSARSAMSWGNVSVSAFCPVSARTSLRTRRFARHEARGAVDATADAVPPVE